MLDKETYYLKKMKMLMLHTFNMVLKTEEVALKETDLSDSLSVAEMHTLVAVGRHEAKTMGTIAGELLIRNRRGEPQPEPLRQNPAQSPQESHPGRKSPLPLQTPALETPGMDQRHHRPGNPAGNRLRNLRACPVQ